MNENAKKWISALRSGEYKQTTCCLRDLHGFCCLGVACDVYMRETSAYGTTWTKMASLRDRYVFGPDQEQIGLPREVIDWLGLSGSTGKYILGGHDTGIATSLSGDNDGGGKSFVDIADIIESEPEGLFHE